MAATTPPGDSTRRWRWPAAIVFLVLAVVCGTSGGLYVLQLGTTHGHVAIETFIGETPQRRLAQYFDAVRRGDRDAALAAWQTNDSEAALRRRDAVTDELLAIGGDLHYTVDDTEWWSNCCEPHRIDDASAAGVARFHVSVGGDGAAVRHYTIDVTTKGSYWGAAGGDPVRHWALRDVYHAVDQPLAFPWS